MLKNAVSAKNVFCIKNNACKHFLHVQNSSALILITKFAYNIAAYFHYHILKMLKPVNEPI